MRQASRSSPPGSSERVDIPEQGGILVQRFVRASLAFEQAWHAHGRGFLGGLDAGWIGVHLERRTCLLPPGTLCWLPPGEPHAVDAIGPITGWMTLLPVSPSSRLPREPVFRCSTELVRTLLPRMVEVASGRGTGAPLRRLVDVLLDEVQRAPTGHTARLALPRSERLRPALEAVLIRPGAGPSLDEVARRCAMSRRSFTRAFREETGRSFAHWRREAAVVRALAELRSGHSVKQTAHLLGYRSTSAFVAMVRTRTGRPPAALLARERAARDLDLRR